MHIYINSTYTIVRKSLRSKNFLLFIVNRSNKVLWNTIRYCDFKNVYKNIQIRELAKEYTHNYIRLKMLKKMF